MTETIAVGALTFVGGAALGILLSPRWPRLTASERTAVCTGLVIVAVCAFTLWATGAKVEVQGRINPTSADSEKMCVELARDFQETSSRWAIASWSIAIVATLLSAIGGLVGRGAEDEKRWYRLGAGVLLATVGNSLAATAAYSVARSNAASTGAAAATSALTAKDSVERYRRCIAAKSQWLESRSDSLEQNPPSQPMEEPTPQETQNGERSDAGVPPK